MKNHSIIVHPANEEEISVIKKFFTTHKIKFEVSMEKPYNPEFVAKIQESRQQAKEGKVTRVKKEDLKEFLGL